MNEKHSYTSDTKMYSLTPSSRLQSKFNEEGESGCGVISFRLKMAGYGMVWYGLVWYGSISMYRMNPADICVFQLQII